MRGNIGTKCESFHAISSFSQTSTSVVELDRNMEKMFSIVFIKQPFKSLFASVVVPDIFLSYSTTYVAMYCCNLNLLANPGNYFVHVNNGQSMVCQRQFGHE